jgi:hypothetical protein
MAARKGNTHGFAKGRSGNPGGRPRNDPDVMRIFRAADQKAAQCLVALLDAEDPFLRKQVAEYIINRVHGKPRESVEVKTEAPFVFALPPVVEDPDVWEAQTQKILHGVSEH